MRFVWSRTEAISVIKFSSERFKQTEKINTHKTPPGYVVRHSPAENHYKFNFQVKIRFYHQERSWVKNKP